MCDHDRRVSAAQLKIGEETIRRRLRGMDYKLYTRVSANIGVYTKGNEMRMGKGKGKFDYWAARIAVSRIIFEVKGDIHEKVAREAFRLAGDKMPGMFSLIESSMFSQDDAIEADNEYTQECMNLLKRAILPLLALRSWGTGSHWSRSRDRGERFLWAPFRASLLPPPIPSLRRNELLYTRLERCSTLCCKFRLNQTFLLVIPLFNFTTKFQHSINYFSYHS
jgi:ribosomal protein L16